MFTPQRKPWSGWSLNPRREQNGSAIASGSAPGNSSPRNGETTVGKDKGLLFIESTPDSLAAEKYAELDKEAVCDKLSKLENELLEYQYNMGLLLIEKKEWTCKYEELKRALADLDDAYKREKSAHFIAITEVEKREENLRNALGIEKQCVLDLEKALREMRSEYAEIKFTADSKLAEAESLVASIEQKSLEVEAKLHATDAKLAEVNRKSSEIERKSQELVAQEIALRRERSSFAAERDMHESSLSKQREDLREWEQKLQEGEERLAELRRLLNQREKRANEYDNLWKQKQKELEVVQKKVDVANLSLKEKEEDMSRRQASLSSMEKEADTTRNSLELKEKQLIELEEKLNMREKVEIQKLLDEHKTTLDTKEKEFELEMEQRRKSLYLDMENKAAEVLKKEAELKHMEEKIRKREQALEKKSEKVRERENELELKLKALKEREKSLKVEEKDTETERKQTLAEKESLLVLKIELEKTRSDIENQQLKIREEMEQLKVTVDERSEHARLQLELKQEIDKCRLQSELLLKEAEDLKQERLRFEKDWEELDVKQTEVKKELADFAEQKNYFEKMRWAEEERLKNEKLETENYVRRELESLEVARHSFAATMEHERTILAEKTESQRSKMLDDFEIRKRELESDMQKKQEEMENQLHEMKNFFEQDRERELNNINNLKNAIHQEMEELKVKRHALENEKQEIFANKKQLEVQHGEMRKDIDELVVLSKKLKDQREQLVKERERFVAFVDKQKSCESCAELVREFVTSDLQSLDGINNLEAPVLPKIAENYLRGAAHGNSETENIEISPSAVELGSPASGGTISWLRKCTSSIFRFSPGKKIEFTAARGLTDGASLPGSLVNVESRKTLPSSENEPKISFGVAEDSLDIQRIQSDNSTREFEAGPDPSVNDRRSQHSNPKVQKRRHGKRGRPKINREGSGKVSVADRRRVIDEDAFVESDGQRVNGNIFVNEESRGESGAAVNGRKRNLTQTSQATPSEHDGEYSGYSGSVTGEGHRKRRRRVAPPVQTLGEKRYNLRRPRSAAAAAANGVLSDPSKEKDREIGGHSSHVEQITGSKATHSNNVEVARISVEEIRDSDAAGSASEGAKGDGGEIKSIPTAHEFSADSPVMLKDATVAQDGVSDTVEVEFDTRDEVNGTPERAREDRYVENKGQPLEDEEDDEVDEFDHPGEASVAKKVWNFLTT
ncbi:nuclear matrix constituent protein 1-like isoform X1 [Coffea arabica]|uniref:Nuclear matrix constituent protein 1-like isoform X1 n=1 Tax=Coffea arabica TaxID=13443 RepID=A0A6P6TEM2_COFAR